MFRKILWGIIPTLLLGVVACSDDTSSDSFTASPVYGESCSSVIGESSSSVGPAPESSDAIGTSSSEIAQNSSSNVAGESSSSIIANSSSSVGVLVDSTACLWNAKKGEYIVKTGFDPDDKHGAGYWYSYSDNDDGGMSHVEWDAECLNDGTDCMQHLVDECGGICGKMYWDKGNAPEAVVGVAFNVAGFEDPAADVAHPLSADISDWGGICVTYSSDLNLYVRLGVGEDAEVIAELGKSENLVEKCLTWADFDKDAEGENPMPAAEAAKKIKNIKFGKISGESMSGHFTIASVGKYVASGACNVGLVNSNPSSSSVSSPVLSSSSVSGDCAEPKSVSEMWNGFEAPISYVETGADNGTETSGYWFSFGDGMDGIGAVKLPQTLGHEYKEESEIFDYCMGVCGEFQFAKEGYMGVGFHVAGVVEPLDGNSPAAKANISSWGGLCVTYASESDLDVVLAYAQNDGFGNLSRMPKTTLPKSTELKTVCVDWDNYFMSVYSEVSTTSMTSILFAVQGNANAKSRFNIRGLGKYSKTTNFCAQGEDEFVSGKKDLVIK